MRVFIPSDGVIETNSEALAAFVQDRITVGDHWSFNAGLRYEDQSHDNDIGQELVQSSDLAPRLAVTYDVGGDGQAADQGHRRPLLPARRAEHRERGRRHQVERRQRVPRVRLEPGDAALRHRLLRTVCPA